jgi:hypothetical protein
MTNSSVSEIQEKLQEIVEEYQPVIKTKTVPFVVKPKTELSVFSDEQEKLRKTG